MTVAFKSALTSANTNSGFMSRKAANTDTESIVELKNTQPESGPAVTNLQASVNNAENQIQTVSNVINGASLSINEKQGKHTFFLSGSGGPVTLSSTPFGASFAGLDGTHVHLVGLDDTNTVLLLFSDTAKGVLLNGNALLERGSSITLVWSETLDRWVELSRNF
jgi:hypothetical protein